MISLFQKTFFSLLFISVFSVYAPENDASTGRLDEGAATEMVTTASGTSTVVKNDEQALSDIIAQKFRFSTSSSLCIDSLLQGLSLTAFAIAAHDFCLGNGTVDSRRFAVGLSILSLYGVVHGCRGVSEIYSKKYSDTTAMPTEQILRMMNNSCYKGYLIGIASALLINGSK